MPRKTLTDEQDTYLKLIAPGKSVQTCTDLLNEHFSTSFTLGQIRSYKRNHQILSGKKPWEFVDHSKWKITTAEQDAYILENYRGIGNKELAEKVNKKFDTGFTPEQMDNYKGRHKLNSGLTGYFAKGNIPLNKGKKMSKEQYEKVKHTMFGTGNVPENTDPIGTEKMLADGYVWVKINDFPKTRKSDNWKQKHRLMWEEVNGPIPKGSKLMFADGNREHIEIDNLILVTLAESLIMNQYGLIKANSELTKTGALIAKVIDKTHKAKRRKP